MKRITWTILVFTAAIAAFASDAVGRDIAAGGVLETHEGKLGEKDSEWTLTVGKTVYQLHFGNGDWFDSTGIRLKVGDAVQVTGFTQGDDIAVARILVGGKTYTFRSAAGQPAWAGNGRNAGTGTRSGAGSGG